MYLDDLLRSNFEATKDWCYTGVGVLEFDVKMRDYLADNHYSYPVVTRFAGANTSEDQMKVQVQDVTSLRDMLLSFEDPLATVALLANADVRVVSLTITEFGYRVPLNADDFKLVELALSGHLMDFGDGSDAAFTTGSSTGSTFPQLAHPAPSSDVVGPAYRNATVFGLLMASLAVRFTLGRRPYTVMSCDNLPHNGEVAKKRLLVGRCRLTPG